MTTFLDRVIAERSADALTARTRNPAGVLDVSRAPTPRSLFHALAHRGPDHFAVIAEVKRVSPAAGVLAAQGLDPAALALLYAGAGAAAISVLTEPRHWGGSIDDLRAVRAAVKVPVICKDVIVDEYQVYEARAAGADAVLLIAEALDDGRLHALLATIARLGMEALVEAHDPRAFGRAVRTRTRILGANARDLRDPSVIDRSRARLLHTFVRPEQLFVAESGIASAADLAELPARVDAILVGTALMRSEHPAALVRELATAKRPATAGAARTSLLLRDAGDR